MTNKEHWWEDCHNLHLVAAYMCDQCSSMDEMRRVIGEVLSKPWNWYVEYVIATCIQKDSRPVSQMEQVR